MNVFQNLEPTIVKKLPDTLQNRFDFLIAVPAPQGLKKVQLPQQ